MFRLLRILCVTVVLVGIFCISLSIWGYFQLQEWGRQERQLAAPIIVDLSRGESLRQFSTELGEAGLVRHRLLFEVWVRLFQDYRRFQAGQYRFENAVSPDQIVAALVNGRTWEPVVLQFTIPEGFTVKKVAARLAALGVGTETEFEQLATDEQLLTELGIPSSSIEGYLYPATYPFKTIPTSREALSVMVRTFWEKLPVNYEQRVSELGLSLGEAVTFASLIELETRLDDERPLVSEVIWRRLQKKMALAIDASIIYGIQDYDGNIRTKHLKDKANPYNTRVHLGLPPTPIGSPSRASLEAVLKPTDHGYYYYVLDLRDGSRHHFSKTLREHNQRVRELLQERRRQREAAKN